MVKKKKKVAKKNFKKGDRVGYYDTENYNEYYGGGNDSGKLRYDEYGDGAPVYGVVSDELSENRVLIKWDKGAWMNDGSPFDQEDLQPETKLKAEYSKLEKAFKAAEKQVRSKIKSAAKSIDDAQKMAKKAGLYLNELTKAIGPLENAMGRAGWQTSSWACPGF